MRKVSEYLRHAGECRQMAAQMTNAVHKQQLEEMARAWDALAETRRQQLLKQAGGDPDRAAHLEQTE